MYISTLSQPYLSHISAISQPYLSHISAIAKLCHEMVKSSCSLDFDFHLLLSNITVHLCIEHQNHYLCISLGLLVFNSGDCPEMRTIVKWIMFYWFTSKGPEVTKVDVTIWCLSIHWLCFVNFTTNQLVLTKQACIPCL